MCSSDLTMVAGDADGCSLSSGHHVGPKTETLNFGADVGDVLLGRERAHYD